MLHSSIKRATAATEFALFEKLIGFSQTLVFFVIFPVCRLVKLEHVVLVAKYAVCVVAKRFVGVAVALNLRDDVLALLYVKAVAQINHKKEQGNDSREYGN